MDTRTVRRSIIEPALLLLPAKMESPQAIAMLLTIGLQESKLEARRQAITRTINGVKTLVPEGPATSFWQMERGGGVHGVLTHQKTATLAAAICAKRNVKATERGAWEAIEHDDILAACLARLLLYTDPFPLPDLGDEAGAWELYLRTWRPGAYSRGDAARRAALRKKWATNYAAALEAVQ
ncbi:hypothetical protein [Pseudomonas sp. C9-3]|uniref:hypothetical protein n=1 Tax=Pseudomonas sp. C9-3 TaxID=3078264 RepID=UPI0028ED15B3|nr:hypothetical protein [Pseudomonas sp. C9-3]